MSKKIDVLRARLLVAQAKEEKNASKNAPKKSKKSKENPEKENKASAQKTDAKKGAKNEKSTRNPPTVEWSKEPFYFMKDELLTIIESKPRFRQAFGFDKGIDGPVDTGGKKLPAIQADVAEALFITGKADTKYTTEDLPDLAKVVKNRIAALKTAYTNNRKKLSETGHGLVAAGKEDDIKSGTEISNAWDAIQEKFPWYMRMHDLMGSSPVINRSAVAHSGTRVDLSILDRDGEAHEGPISVASDDESKFSGWDTSSPAPAVADDGDDSDSDVPATPVVKVKAEARPPPLSSARGSKRKSIHDHIQDLTTQNHTKQIKLAEVKEREKTVRAKAKYDAKNNLEMARLDHQQREAERQRAHEVFMLERQMQLEGMRRNAPAPSTGMYGPGAPAYGAPPPNFVFDPALQ
ncbi:hypothetical protein MVEN_01157300 [Mycena venus]|uniref:Uncharacterized protein n=1 Tax=Mycena venus TaxID=2733690 RepID=A0A8H6Y288_9AGAR|nr:hypothetical protein MVEN_01157300 [Mycena venus]